MTKLLSCIAIIAIIATITISQSSIASGLFTIRNIKVQSDGQNAFEARNKAVTDGEKQAFVRLFKRMTPRSYHKSIPEIESEAISNMVQAMQLENEDIGSNFYKGEFSITFNQPRFENFLKDSDINQVYKESRKIIVLPILQEGEKKSFWFDESKWNEAWQKTAKQATFIPLSLTSDQISQYTIDKIIDNNYVISEDAYMFRLYRSMKAKSVLVPIANYKTDKKGAIYLEVRLNEFAQNSQESTIKKFYGKKGEPVADVMQRASNEILNEMTNVWKNSQVQKQKTESKINITVPFEGLNEWNNFKSDIQRFSFIEQFNINELTVKYAEIELTYYQQFEEFVYNLELSGYELKETRPTLENTSEYVLVPSLRIPANDF